MSLNDWSSSWNLDLSSPTTANNAFMYDPDLDFENVQPPMFLSLSPPLSPLPSPTPPPTSTHTSLPRIDEPTPVPKHLQTIFIHIWTKHNPQTLLSFLKGPPHRLAIMLGAIKRRLPEYTFTESKRILAKQVVEALTAANLNLGDILEKLPDPQMWSTGPLAKQSKQTSVKKRKFIDETEEAEPDDIEGSSSLLRYAISLPISIMTFSFLPQADGTASLCLRLNSDARALLGYSTEELSDLIDKSIEIRSRHNDQQLTPWDWRLFHPDDWGLWIESKWDLWISWNAGMKTCEKKMIINIINKWSATIKVVLTCRVLFTNLGLPQYIVFCISPLPC